MAWDTEVAALVAQLEQAPDDPTVRAARGEIETAEGAIVAASVRLPLYEAEIALPGGGMLGLGGRGPHGRGIYRIRVGGDLPLRYPIETWTPAEIIDAHAAMPDLIAALAAAAGDRTPRVRSTPPAGPRSTITDL